MDPNSAKDKNDHNDDQRMAILLFYKYHPLSSTVKGGRLYQEALQELCAALEISQGRLLIGCNAHRSEGINGTVAGRPTQLQLFIDAMSQYHPNHHQHDRHEGSPPVMIKSPTTNHHNNSILVSFWNKCRLFYEQADCPPLIMHPIEDFKLSYDTTHKRLFPDLHIKMVSELIGTGGRLASIGLNQVSQGYLTPAEWHDELRKLQQQKNGDSDTLLIDCRNTKEYDIGHFPNAIDPNTTTFHEFPQWVQRQLKQKEATKQGDDKSKNSNSRNVLQGKKRILMYCTGGIRCEKASAYIRNELSHQSSENVTVQHLKGGIHKYLDEYGDKSDCLWRGKNFVFDGRGAHGAVLGVDDDMVGDSSQTHQAAGTSHGPASTSSTSRRRRQDEIIGSCLYCPTKYDQFHPDCVCTVCREPTLVCPACRKKQREYHCKHHFHLRDCYFTDLTPFSIVDLQTQLEQLQFIMLPMAVGKKFKRKRKTLTKQCDKIHATLMKRQTMDAALPADHHPSPAVATNVLDDHEQLEQQELKCRNCGCVGCPGNCWGFHGLQRKQALDDRKENQRQYPPATGTTAATTPTATARATDSPFQRNSSRNSPTKKPLSTNKVRSQKRKLQVLEQARDELRLLKLAIPPAIGRNPQTGIRIPQPCTRILQTTTKRKWVGNSLRSVLQQEFHELATDSQLEPFLVHGLIRINDQPIQSLQEADQVLLKNMDVISRIVHWHEPPVFLPEPTIDIQKVSLPAAALQKALRREHSDDDGTNGVDLEDDRFKIYVCHKPASVPVHPAGPYLSNSLTIMAEAQEGLAPKSLLPCHRIDRATSGLTLCCRDPSVARLLVSRIDQGTTEKEYVALVKGTFPSSEQEWSNVGPPSSDIASWSVNNALGDDVNDNDDDDLAAVSVSVSKNAVEVIVHAPIETVDPARGVRQISLNGKPSESRFRLLRTIQKNDDIYSLIRCRPLTGRSHQLRVHLQWLGFPIVKDSHYGGEGDDLSSSTTQMSSHRAPPRDDGVATTTATDLPKETECHLPHLTKQEVDATQSVCVHCHQGGQNAAFSPAQRLQGGHEICLHAHRYRIMIQDDMLVMSVGLPSWAKRS